MNHSDNNKTLTDMKLTLGKSTNPDGTWQVEAGEIVAAAVAAAKHQRGKLRGTFPRFSLWVDGERKTCESRQLLRRWLESIRPGEECAVYRNAGFGATITFDQPLPPY